MKTIKIAMISLLLMALAAPAYACTIEVLGVVYTDTDCDKIMDYTDMTDADFNGVPDGDPVDNCPLVPNGNCNVDQLDCDADGNSLVSDAELKAGFQLDWNDNGAGDVCDDTDFDGVVDYLDNCKTVFNADQDPSVCTDTDHDKFEDPIDNCPVNYNPDQMDSDDDGIGDWCDNCRIVFNPDQADSDDDNVGDMCESGDYVSPDVDQDESQDVNPYDGPRYGTGPEEMQGNGFGDGGCSLVASAQASSMASFLLIALAAISIAIRRK